MNASQIPYDQLDWLQIAIYFVALPLFAFLGATLGLIGRIRRGGLLWSTNVGLLGGAVACLIIALGISTLESESITTYFYLFQDEFRWKMLAATLAATGACSVVAAFAWRFLYAPREKQPFAFSMRSILLVQFFAFLGMGSFIGLRLFMLEQSGQVESLHHQIPIPGWVLLGETEICFDDELPPEQLLGGYAADRLLEIARRARIRCINLELDSAWNIDLRPLQRDIGYECICATCKDPDHAMIEQLAGLHAKHYWLNGDFAKVDLSPIAHVRDIEKITLDGKYSRDSLELFGKHEQLEEIVLYGQFTPDKATVIRWPPRLRKLRIDASATIENRDLKALANHPTLEVFDAIDFTLNEESLAAIQSIVTLKQAKVCIGPLSSAGHESLTKLSAPHVMLIVKNPELAHADIERILRIKGLEVLDFYDSVHGDKGIDEISKKESLERINISSPLVTKQAVLQLAALPKLDHLGFPKHLAATSFVEDFHTIRDELGLPFVNLVANQRTPAQPAAPLPESKP